MDSAGITDAVLDEESNKISAKIAHFSDIGLAEKSGSGQSAQVISSIEISPESATLTVGDSAQFTAVVTDTAGATIDTTVTWSVSGGIGSVSESGNFTAETAGSGFVTAQVGSVSDSVAVTVTAPAEPEEPVVSAIIGSIVISPADTTVGLQDSLQLQATVSDTSGANVDTVVTWAVLDTTVGTIDQTGLFLPLSVGTARVTATIGEITDTSSVTVSEPASEGPPSSIEISPEIKTIGIGDSLQFQAEVSDTAGILIDTTVT